MQTILLVDDKELNLDMLSRRLERKGYQVLTAVDAIQGIAITRSEDPSLIIMDMSLPVLSGWAAAKQLKVEPQTNAIPIIGLSSVATAEDKTSALAAGCDDYDVKPVDFGRLIDKIEALLGPTPSKR